MKSRILTLLTATAFFAGLAAPVGIAQANPQFHHYQLIDMGTFGGTLSNINPSGNFVPAVNGQGRAVGFSANKVPLTGTSNPTACQQTNTVTEGFEWNNGKIKNLGSLAGSHFCSDADSINDFGEIEGVSEINAMDPATGLNEVRAVIWKNGQITELGTLGGNNSWGFGINDVGQVIGWSLNTTPDPFSIYDFGIFGSTLGTQTRGFLWQNGKMQDLGTLGGPDATPFFINQLGQVAGNSYTNSTPNASTGVPTIDPFLWTKGKMQDLGSLGGAVGFVQALNNLGEVVGRSSTAADPAACNNADNDVNCHPFLWDGAELIDLATSTTGGIPFDVQAINDFGEIVGGANFPADFPNTFQGYLWIGGTAIDLGHLSADCFSEAHAINLEGHVVGESLDCAVNNHAAVLWEGGSIVDLNTLVPAGSSLQLVSATAITNEGLIAGTGTPPGVSPDDWETMGHAFLLIPCDENHPGIKGCDYSQAETERQPTWLPDRASETKIGGGVPKQEVETPARLGLRKRRRPEITSFSPASGRVGSQVQVFGKNFKWVGYVSFGGLSADFSIDSTSQLTATVPNIQSNAPIIVDSGYGGATSPTDFGLIPGAPGCYLRGHFCSLNPSPGAEKCCAGLVCSHISCGPLCGTNFCSFAR